MAMKQAAEYLLGLCYNLRMFGIPVDDPVFIYGDNQSVIVNASAPESTLKKKSQSITFYFIRECCATYEWCMTYIHTSLNVSDLMKNRSQGRSDGTLSGCCFTIFSLAAESALGLLWGWSRAWVPDTIPLGCYMIAYQVQVKTFIFLFF